MSIFNRITEKSKASPAMADAVLGKPTMYSDLPSPPPSNQNSFSDRSNRMSIDDDKPLKTSSTQTEDMPYVHPPSDTALASVASHLRQIDTSLQCTKASQTLPLSDIVDSSVDKPLGENPKLQYSDFHFGRTLGTGSFGRVVLAQAKTNGQYYAIKILKKSTVVRLRQVEHTNNEKNILADISHPFLVNLWGSFQDETNLYMVMDYIPGGELFSVLRKCKKFPDQVAKFYAAQVVLAFHYLHTKNIVYRDLKPENILLDAKGQIRITDFGFAKYVPDVTWTLCGTPDYLAPEIIQAKGYSKAVDWWSLGILIYEMLAGYPPFYDDDHMKLYEKIVECKITWPSHFSAEVKDLLQHLLTPDLSKRYGNLKNGSEDIMKHAWFQGVNFTQVLQYQVQAPYIPRISSHGDARNFDRYPEERKPKTTPQEDPYKDLFTTF